MGDEHFDDPLREAVRAGDAEALAAALLAPGVRVDHRDYAADVSALELAVSLGRLDFARTLLDHRADPGSWKVEERSALVAAARLPPALALEATRLLLDHGAPVPARSEAIRVAAEEGLEEVVELLLAEIDDEERGWPRRRLDEWLLRGAAVRGDIARVKTLLDAHPELLRDRELVAGVVEASSPASLHELIGPLGNAALPASLKAAFRAGVTDGWFQVLETLVRSADDATMVLESAIARRAENGARLLALAISRGARVDNRSGGVPLFLRLAQVHDAEGMQWLASHGADVHARDEAGNGAWAYSTLWAESVNAGTCRACLERLGVERSEWRGPLPLGVPPRRGDLPHGLETELWAVGVGCGIGVLVVVAVVALHLLGLL